MKNKKIKLTKKDLHIIDVYSKKNFTETMPQFGDQDENTMIKMQGMSSVQNENKINLFE